MGKCSQKRLTNGNKNNILKYEMQTIDVLKCKARGQFEGDMAFEFPLDDALIGIPFVTFAAPATASLHYEIYDDGDVSVTGSVCFTLRGECSVCLTPTEKRFTGEVNAYFTRVPQEDEDYTYNGGTVDLNECLRDAVLIALPPRLECGRQACKCPNINQ